MALNTRRVAKNRMTGELVRGHDKQLGRGVRTTVRLLFLLLRSVVNHGVQQFHAIFLHLFLSIEDSYRKHAEQLNCMDSSFYHLAVAHCIQGVLFILYLETEAFRK